MSQHYRTSVLPVDPRISGRGRPERPPLIHNMSPDRGALAASQYQKYDRTYRYRDEKLNYDIFTDHRPQQESQKLPFIRKNGFVYEDIYSGSTWNGEFKNKHDYSSPYKAIKPQYLTLGNSLATKYSTLPKSWSANTSSNSYSRNCHLVAPIRSNFRTKDELMKDFNYERRRLPRDYRREYILSLQDKLSNERRFDHTKTYDNSVSAKYYVNAAVASQMGNSLPSRHKSVDSYQSAKTVNGVKQDRWPVRHSEFFDHVVQQDVGKRQTTKLVAYEYNQVRYAENRPLRRAEYEVKKNVTFSEVSGCEERNNVVGGKSGLVRELEVALNQVDNGKMTRTPALRNGTAVMIPNGHCIGAGKCVDQNFRAGRLPPKAPPPGGFLDGLTRKKYLSQVINVFVRYLLNNSTVQSNY